MKLDTNTCKPLCDDKYVYVKVTANNSLYKDKERMDLQGEMNNSANRYGNLIVWFNNFSFFFVSFAAHRTSMSPAIGRSSALPARQRKNAWLVWTLLKIVHPAQLHIHTWTAHAYTPAQPGTIPITVSARNVIVPAQRAINQQRSAWPARRDCILKIHRIVWAHARAQTQLMLIPWHVSLKQQRLSRIHPRRFSRGCISLP